MIEALEPKLLFSADIFGGVGDAPNAEDPLQTLLDEATGKLTQQPGDPDSNRDESAAVEPLLLDESEFQAILGSEPRLRSELVFVDPATPDYQQLLDDLLSRQDDCRQIEVVLLEADRDGVAQIGDVLAGFRDLDAVHIISHGSDGAIRIGNTTLDQARLDTESNEIESWSQAFHVDGDLLIYGCDLAATAEGELVVDALAGLTGDDVSASADLTGHESLGGDWDLEYQTGRLETNVAVSQQAQMNWSATLASYTVINTNDSGAGSLRQAIIDVNANSGTDDIVFNIGTGDSGYIDPTLGAPGSGDEYWSIQLSTVLPAITEAVALDATTQNPFTGTPVIELDGSIATGSDENGITIETGGGTIRGFAINRFLDDAIEIDNQGGGNTIVGNYLGTDITGQLSGYRNR